MATFIVNERLAQGATVEAQEYKEEGSFVHFYDSDLNMVYSIPTIEVKEIKRKN